ncbi:hypothetical protein [Thermus sp. LT1-2-5]|uniref:hypothetical protein n=1 Tax=Thermus sp. LT1-2-5 TaxID=3026935 RepID=UPI003365947C
MENPWEGHGNEGWEMEDLGQELAYWLDWADGVICDLPEPGEDEEAEAREGQAFLYGWEELDEPQDLPASAGVGLLWVLLELEGHAGVYEEVLARTKLYAFRHLLGERAPDLPLLRREDGSVLLTKEDLLGHLDRVLELYHLDFPLQAYRELRAWREARPHLVQGDSPELLGLLAVLEVAWDCLERHLEHDPDRSLQPYAPPEHLAERLRLRKSGLLVRLGRKGVVAPGLVRAVHLSRDLYEVMALEALVACALGL